jgi:hypothetical protein
MGTRRGQGDSMSKEVWVWAVVLRTKQFFQRKTQCDKMAPEAKHDARDERIDEF